MYLRDSVVEGFDPITGRGAITFVHQPRRLRGWGLTVSSHPVVYVWGSTTPISTAAATHQTHTFATFDKLVKRKAEIYPKAKQRVETEYLVTFVQFDFETY